jgi:hypothetical protein
MKLEVTEVRTVVYTLEVPDGVTRDELRAIEGRLDSRRLWARGSGGVIADQGEVSYSFRPCDADDDEPADVQFDARLHDCWPPETASVSSVPQPHMLAPASHYRSSAPRE